MTDHEREELLSAYLDDELSSDVRARIESWLAEDPAARQTFEELQALRTSIQALPSVAAPADFADRILTRVGQLDPSEEEPATIPFAARYEEPRQWFGPGGRAWRPLAWAAMALAASILVMMFAPREEQELALAPRDEAPKLASAPEPGAADAALSEAAPPAPAPIPQMRARTKELSREMRAAPPPPTAPEMEAAPALSSDAPDLPLSLASETLFVQVRASSPPEAESYLLKLVEETGAAREELEPERAEADSNADAALASTADAIPPPNQIVVRGTQAQLDRILARFSEEGSPIQLESVAAAKGSRDELKAADGLTLGRPAMKSARQPELRGQGGAAFYAESEKPAEATIKAVFTFLPESVPAGPAND